MSERAELPRSGGAAGGVLPVDGDLIEFGELPRGSVIPQPIVTPEGSKPLPVRRYRVEKKPLDLEYLLIDVVSGHAFRVPAHEFNAAKWDTVSRETLNEEAKEKKDKEELEASGPASSASQPDDTLFSAKPLSSPEGRGAAGGVLSSDATDDDEEEVEEEEDDPVTKTKVKVKKKVKKKK